VLGVDGPSIVAFSNQKGLFEIGPGGGRFPFMNLTLSGKESQGESMRSNRSGIGTSLRVRFGDRWASITSFRSDSGPGQGLQPLSIGLAGAQQADFVEIDWSDGVFQSEIALEANQPHHVTETQRQLSSCPLLFAWDGDGYEFVSDVLGVGGIGFAVGPGEYAPSRPWENFLLPQGSLSIEDGLARVKLGEPMEEALYLDSAGLTSYDLPRGWSMVLDERMAVLPPEATGEPIFYRQAARPSRATNDRGQDVTTEIARADFSAAPPGALDHRFIGRLESVHELELEFDEPVDFGRGDQVLRLDGWVEYPYSQTMFSAWQAGAAYEAPSLDAWSDETGWVEILHQFGYPAGMPRVSAVPIPALDLRTKRLRIRTNQEIYFDQIMLCRSEPCPDAIVTRHPLASAELRFSGFPKRIDHPQRRPEYVYAERTPFWDTKIQEGAYTRFGPVLPLVQRHDDALAIIGPGEEIHLEFKVDSGPALDRQRFYVLESHGWCKDMDLYTRDGETLDPLPSSGLDPSVPRSLHAEFNTRYLGGR